jgi:hypothetical protein
MNEVKAAIGEIRLKYKDQVLCLLPPNYDVEEKYADFLYESVIRRTCKYKAAYTPEVFLLQLDRNAERFGSNKFGWGSDTWRESLWEKRPMQHLAFLCFTRERSVGGGPANPITEGFIDDIWEEEYKDEGDEWYQRRTAMNALALENKPDPRTGTVPPYLPCTYGNRIWSAVIDFINRPNSPTPPGAGDASTTSSKSAPSSPASPG